MSKSKLGKLVQSIRTAVSDHAPEILTGIGVAGAAVTTILAVGATPKALALIEEEKRRQNYNLLKEAEENGDEDCPIVDRLAPLEVVKTTWKCYIPAAITFVASASCLIGASATNHKRNAALAAAYKLSETALTEYREKVVETFGEKKEQVVRDKVAKEQLEQHPVTNREIIVTGRGETMCFDPITSRRFFCDIETIRRAVNELNKRMFDEMYISLNEFYMEIGLSTADIGEDMGWNISKGLIDLRFSAQLDETDTPCLVLDHINPPSYGFTKL